MCFSGSELDLFAQIKRHILLDLPLLLAYL